MWSRRCVLNALAVAAFGAVQVSAQAAQTAEKDIVTTAVEAGSFKTLAAALKAAELVETLQSKGPFTAFAPTDEAFAKLPEGTVETLLKPENKDKLAAILKFHVVPGRFLSSDVMSRKELKTVQGGVLAAAVKDGAASINGAGIVATDIDASNGVIHVIDTVMLPPAEAKKASSDAQPASHNVSYVCPQTGRVKTYRVTKSVRH